MDQTLRPSSAPRIFGPARVADVVWRWIDAYPMLVRAALAFVAVLGLVSAAPVRPAARSVADTEIVSTPAPYFACGIARTFDGHRCVPVKPAPVSCVQSARGCMATTATLPTPASEPAPAVVQAPADPFAGIMGIRKE